VASVGQRGPEAGEIARTRLLAPDVVDDPNPFYSQLRAQAPVWDVPGTALFTVSTFELVAEATGRVEDFSSNIRWLLYRDDAGLPCRLPFGDAGAQALATADPPMHALHRKTVFPELVAKRMAELEPGGCRAPTSRSAAAAFITASARHSPASRGAPCSPCCSTEPGASPSTPSTRRAGSTA
jgi:cytochrome P450